MMSDEHEPFNPVNLVNPVKIFAILVVVFVVSRREWMVKCD